MCILCSKSLWKHDTQWSRMPLPPQCPSPVQQKQMGCTFFRNSQEKWSDLICLRLPPTKQMDHLLIPPSYTTYSTYQEECQIWMDNGTSTSLRLTQKFPCSQSCPCLPRLLGSLWNPFKSTPMPPNTKPDPSIPKKTSHLHSILGNLLILKWDTPSQNLSCLR
jgi:hypothetical protein